MCSGLWWSSLHGGSFGDDELLNRSILTVALSIVVTSHSNPVSTALIYLTHYGNGSATLMRGKSATCRRRTFFFIRVFDPPRSKTVQNGGRASEWQSHCSGRIEVRQKSVRSQVRRV